jgi:c-di-GMP-binding flagellar brake protein YcgR
MNPKTGRFLINKFQSEPAHQKLLESKKFYAYSQLNGIEIRFFAGLIKVLTEGDDVYYLITLPGKIDYHQRRAFHRVALSHTVIPVSLTLEDKSTIEGQMDDISAGGISILFASDLPPKLRDGTQIGQCMFQIPGGDLVACQLQVRFIIHGHDTSLPKIGAQFINTDKTQKNYSAFCVVAAETTAQGKHRSVIFSRML